MDRPVDIHKAGGILIRDRRLLLTRTRGQKIYLNPGGKLEPGESIMDALVRELHEELSIVVDPAKAIEFGTFYAEAAGQTSKWLRMDMFMVTAYEGRVEASGEIEEVRWVTSELGEGVVTGSIFQYEIIPRLKRDNLID